MTVTMLGAEFKRFYTDPMVWTNDTYHDDALILVDGVNASDADIDLSAVADTAKVTIESGVIGDAPPGVPEDLIDAIQWWRTRQSTCQYVVTLPKEKAEAFEACVASLGLQDAMTRVG